MRRTAFSVITFLFLLSPVYCQEMPKDVPSDNFAYSAIQDLVDRGINVSQGYPDGTFRGSRNTSRYQNAYFMASLALKLQSTASLDPDFPDIKDEISYLRNDIEQAPAGENDMDFSGSLELQSKFGSLFAYDRDNRAPAGPETFYRFKYSIEKKIGDDANLKMNIDTMDGAFNSATLRNFATKIMDVEGNLAINIGLENPLKIRTLFGPGSVLHRDTSGVAPSEDSTYFIRPRPTLTVSTVLAGWNVAGTYAARGLDGFGTVGTDEVNVQFNKKIGVLPMVGTSEFTSTTRYVFVDFLNPTSMANDFKQELSLLMAQSKDVSEKVLIGSGSTDHPNSQYYLNFELYLKNLFNKAIGLNLYFNSVGMDYRQGLDRLEFLPLNLFNRKILDGTLDLGLELSAPLTDKITFKNKMELVTDSFCKIDRDAPGSSYTHELSLDILISNDLSLNTFYRYYFVPSKLDQFSNQVPEESDLFGLGLTWRF
jgi:hypothetical protein